ncbi:MFS transporter [Candidatus Poribacteria bacterium]|nr:MFS transporter [Candidatus Poribacteria bacterium]
MNSSKSRIHYGWGILVIGTLVVFGSLGLARFSYTLVLPAMQRALGMDNTQAGVLATANLIGYLALSVIGGALASRYGPRIVITMGLFLAAVGMVFTGLSKSFLPAAFWRALTGIGSGASNVPVMGLISAWFAPKRRGLAAGVVVAGSSVAIIFIGPLVPQILTHYGEDSWRLCWYIFGGVTLLLALCSFAFLRNRPGDVGLEPLGIDDKVKQDADRISKLSWGNIYRSFTVWHMGFVYAAFGFSYIIYMTFFAKHLITEGGYTQAEAGKLFMLMGWFSLFCGVIWGAISDRIGRRGAMFIVYLIQATAFSLFSLWSSTPGFVISAVLFGLTAWSIPAIMAAACGDVLGPRFAPAALGFTTLFFGIGQALGPSIAGAIADSVGSFYHVFLLASGVAILGAIGSLMIRRTS